MSGLQSALDELAAEDADALTDSHALDQTALLVAAPNQLDAELTRTVRHAELTRAPEHDGLTSMRSLLIGHQRLSAKNASKLTRAGRTLPSFPRVAAGFADGSITAAQVEVIADAVGPKEIALAVEQGVDLAAFDTDGARVRRSPATRC